MLLGISVFSHNKPDGNTSHVIMLTSSNGNIFRLTGNVRGIHRSPVNSPHKGQWRGALMFSLICAWINGWVNNREAGDLSRHHAHYDVIAMIMIFIFILLLKMLSFVHDHNLGGDGATGRRRILTSSQKLSLHNMVATWHGQLSNKIRCNDAYGFNI